MFLFSDILLLLISVLWSYYRFNIEKQVWLNRKPYETIKWYTCVVKTIKVGISKKVLINYYCYHICNTFQLKPQQICVPLDGCVIIILFTERVGPWSHVCHVALKGEMFTFAVPFLENCHNSYWKELTIYPFKIFQIQERTINHNFQQNKVTIYSNSRLTSLKFFIFCIFVTNRLQLSFISLQI